MKRRSPSKARPARGGKNGYEPRDIVERRKHEVLDRRLRLRHSQHQIAADLGISQAAVSRILRRESERLTAENRGLVTQHRFEAAGTLSHLLREGLEAWTRSQQPRVQKRQRKGADGRVTSDVSVEERAGDPRFLQQVLHALSQLSDVQGLSPKGAPVQGREFSPEYLKEVERATVEVNRKFMALFRQVAPPVVESDEDAEDDPEAPDET